MTITATLPSGIAAKFLLAGERVHAPQSSGTWEGQVVTVVSSERLYADGCAIVRVTVRNAGDRLAVLFYEEQTIVRFAE